MIVNEDEVKEAVSDVIIGQENRRTQKRRGEGKRSRFISGQKRVIAFKKDERMGRSVLRHPRSGKMEGGEAKKTLRHLKKDEEKKSLSDVING